MRTERTSQPRPRWVRPALAGAVLLVAALVVLLNQCPCGVPLPGGPLIPVALLCLLWAMELWWARLPRALFAAGVALAVGWLIWTHVGALSPLFLLLMVAWVAYTGSRRDGLLAAGLAMIAILVYAGHDPPDRWLPWVFGVLAAGSMTHLLVVQQQLVAQLRAAQADLAREAAGAERRRIAGEIHDVAAHSLAVTLLHLTGARLRAQRGGGDPELVAALAEAERLGRQSLDDVRRTVGLLHDGAQGGAAPPLPGAADIPALVAEYRAAGLDVTLEVLGDPGTLPAASGLALYRIAQEALANAVKHAPGASVRVELEVGAGARLRVCNAAPMGAGGAQSRTDGGTGLGLGGMRERAAALGGWLRAGPHRGGWLVECDIPGDARAAPATAVPESRPA